jgi:hypothetical protein
MSLVKRIESLEAKTGVPKTPESQASQVEELFKAPVLEPTQQTEESQPELEGV